MNKTQRSYYKARASRCLLGALALGLASVHAQATVTLDTSNYDCSGSENTNGGVNAALQGAGCADTSMTELYKSNAGGIDEKAYAGSYDTLFTPSADPQDALVTYLGSPALFIDPSLYTELWALAKDGRNEPGWYAWDLLALGWNGTEDLLFDDLWLANGSISHISIFGAEGATPPQSAPEPGMLVLMAIAMAGGALVLGRRRRS